MPQLNGFQRNIYNMEVFYHGTAVSVIGGVIEFNEFVDDRDIRLIVEEIVRKTPSLRLRLDHGLNLYESDDSDFMVAKDFCKGGREEALDFLRSQMRIPFSLYDSRLYDIRIAEYESGKMLFLKIHHLIGDAASVSVLCSRFDEGYKCLKSGVPFICRDTPPVYTRPDEARIKELCGYYDEKLKGYRPERLTGQEDSSIEADEIHFSMPIAGRHMVAKCLAALYSYLSYTRSSRKICIGFVLGGRTRKNAEMFGMYANTLPLILESDGFRISEKDVRAEIFRLFRYVDVSMEDVRTLSGRNQNTYDISFSYRYGSYIPVFSCGTATELFSGVLDVPVRIEVLEGNDSLEFAIFYRNNLFSRDLMEDMGNALMSLPGAEDDDVSAHILSERDALLYRSLNDTHADHRYSDVVECFYRHVTDSEALVSETSSMTGRELWEKSRCLSGYIRSLKAEKVGIDTGRCCEMIVGVLGTLMAGAAFIIISDTIPGIEKFADVVLDRDAVRSHSSEGSAEEGTDPSFGRYDPESTAYMICTSGTSGRPKCIRISRKSLMSRLEWMDRIYGLGGNILQKTVNTFDVSVWEMLSVIFGARLCLLPDGDEKRPDRIAETIRRQHIEKVHFVPSVLSRFIRYAAKNSIHFNDLKIVFTSGEKLERKTAEDFFDVFPGVRLVNLYGPAECTIDVTCYECVKGALPQDIPIGRPVDNTNILILGEENQVLPPLIPGEICVTGELVGKGYISLEDSQETERSQGGFTELNGERAYKTGDMGVLGYDGLIYYQGRHDSQVKIRGMKVNTGAVRQVSLEYPGVDEAAAIVLDNRLICFYAGEADREELAAFLRQKLPSFSVPSELIRVREMPLNNSGKLDMKRLAAEAEDLRKADNSSSGTHEESHARRSSAEGARICGDSSAKMTELHDELLREVRQYVQASDTDNLIQCGLDSLSIMDIALNLQDKGFDIEYADFYEHLSVEEIVRNAADRQYYTYLKKTGSDSVLICFPYAGGQPQDFQAIADRIDTDVIGVYISLYKEGVSIKDMAGDLTDRIPVDRYTHIYIYGQCVGSMTALEYADALGKCVDGIVLAAPAAAGDYRRKSLWNYMSNARISRILGKAGGSGHYTDAVIAGFRKDTDRFFEYTIRPFTFHGVPCKVTVIFGSRDFFTYGRSFILKRLERNINGSLKAYVIHGGAHYLNKSDPEKIARIITRMISGRDQHSNHKWSAADDFSTRKS